MKILQIAQSAIGGGASRVALNLHRGYLRAGHDARLLVKFAENSLPGVVAADAFVGAAPWAGICRVADGLLGKLPPFRGKRRIREGLWDLAWPRRWYERCQGLEDFNYPYSHRLLDNPRWVPDIIHLHNVSTNFFDLRALPALSRRVPVVITLHDCWLFTGHCAHPLDCQRWHSGCGECPDLQRTPAAKYDNTRHNWQRKCRIYAQSHLYVAAVSDWLGNLARKSILCAKDLRVIPNGIDLTIFHPGDTKASRERLGLPQDAFICLFVNKSGTKLDPYKDFATIEAAVADLEIKPGRDRFFFVVVGGRSVSHPSADRKYVGFLADPQELAHYYRAADVFLHASRADSLPTTLLEAQACGTPVIATAVGGIPETMQVGVTGLLVPPGGSTEMAQAIVNLAAHPEARQAIGKAAADWALGNFDLCKQIQYYLTWYLQIYK